MYVYSRKKDNFLWQILYQYLRQYSSKVGQLMNYKTGKDLEGSDQGQKHYHFNFLSSKGAK
jgi:hypothetical protein